MRKNLLNLVSEYAKKNDASFKGRVRLFMLAQKEEIRRTLAHGYGIKTLWKALKSEGRIDCTYSYFCQMIRKYVLAPEKPATSLQKAVIVPSNSSIRQKIEEHKSSYPKIEGFKYNPVPNKDELY